MFYVRNRLLRVLCLSTLLAAIFVPSASVHAQTGICGRTAEVRDAILAEIPDVSDCALVTSDHLAAITGTLNLNGKGITALAAGDFAGLTSLTTLALHENDLIALPSRVFEPLISLSYLNLYSNPGAPFAPVAVALPDDGTVPVAGGTVTLDGSEDGPWGANVTYSWALTNPSSGVTVTFDDAASATPVVTIPALAAGTELTFTLTVTGRGTLRYISGTATGADTATVTVSATGANAAPSFTSPASFDAAENQTAVGTVEASDGDSADSVTGYAIKGDANAPEVFEPRQYVRSDRMPEEVAGDRTARVTMRVPGVYVPGEGASQLRATLLSISFVGPMSATFLLETQDHPFAGEVVAYDGDGRELGRRETLVYTRSRVRVPLDRMPEEGAVFLRFAPRGSGRVPEPTSVEWDAPRRDIGAAEDKDRIPFRIPERVFIHAGIDG